MPTITDALAVKSLAQGLELFGLDPGVWLLIAEIGAFLVALGTLGRKGYKAAKVTTSKAYAWAYPPAPPPPELDPMVQDIVNTLQTCEGEWEPNKNGTGGMYQTGNVMAQFGTDWILLRLEVGGEDAKPLLTDHETSLIKEKIRESIDKSIEDKRRYNRERVRNNLHSGTNGVNRIPLSTTAKVPVGEPKRIIT